MSATRKCLITGASGFIGGYLVDAALKRGYEVWCGVREKSSLARLTDKRIKLLELPYTRPMEMYEMMKDFVANRDGAWDYVIHNAGITKALDKQDFYRVNAYYTKVLIDSLYLADCRPKKFVLISSLSSFGPVRDGSTDPILDSDEQRPDSIYGDSKYKAELFVKTQDDYPYVILRPTGVYGPYDKDYLMEIKSIKKGFALKVGFKPQTLTFIHAKDLAEVAMLTLENPKADYKSFFVADGDVYSDAEFVKLVRKALGKRFVLSLRIPLRLCRWACEISELIGQLRGQDTTLNTDKYHILKQRNWNCDTRPLRKILDFVPEYDLKSGLLDTIIREKI
ncbi:MAG: NAD(P)-dependent oxidoreductase [Tannerella sp.]|jgi:nucleoside-diphosphate-sugar epimerase|nr:NAD(P)-dependent oxidoreductase [Tannerella sp.]